MLTLAAWAASFELVVRDVTGGGETEDAAIVNALVEAVRQVRGLSVDSEKTLRTHLTETEAGRDLRVELREQLRTRSQGQIHTYEVLTMERFEHRWQAQLRVTLPQYASPGPDRSHLRSLAVLPFRGQPGALGGAATSWAWEDVLRRVEQKLVAHFSQSRRFRILDRAFTAELEAEEARLRAGQVPVAELVRLGQQLCADYVVAGDIPACHLLLGDDGEQIEEATVVVAYRVIELAVRGVRWADTVAVSVATDWLARQGVARNRSLALDRILDSAAESIVTAIVDLIYPIKVLKVQTDGTVLLNQGGNRVQPGQWFSVHARESVPDPDTQLHVQIDGKEISASLTLSQAAMPSNSIAKATTSPPCTTFPSEAHLRPATPSFS